MSPEALLRNALRILLPLAVASTFYLYLYPVFQGCAFPIPPQSNDHTQPPLTEVQRIEVEGTDVERTEADRAAAFRETFRQHVLGSTRLAPFRLLALGDPQLEGDTSIRNYGREPFPHLSNAIGYVSLRDRDITSWTRTRLILHDLIDFYFVDIPDFLESIRKRIDLFGNDFFLGHIYKTLHWWAKPTHVTVLGDLLGSQWIGDEEFERRSWRFWNRSFRGGERVPDGVAGYPQGEYDLAGLLGVEDSDAAAWRQRIINIAGNHDIGYAGDLTKARLERFERVFGKAAYELRFELPITNATTNATIFDEDTNPESDRLPPELRIVVLNNMNLDTPAVEPSLQEKTYAFVNDVISTASAVEYKGHFTITLTHIPFYKAEGVCVDAPYFTFHAGGGVKEQNLLSADASRGLLEGIYGLSGDANAAAGGAGRRGVILNGHDHEGCDVWHYIDQDGEPVDGAESEAEAEAEAEAKADDNNVDAENDNDVRQKQEQRQKVWRAARWGDAQRDGLPGRAGLPGLREITVRSMMADFGGNAGLFSAWFDEATWEWRFDFAECRLGRQYYWWFVHVYDLVVLVVALIYGVLRIMLAAGLDVDKWPSSTSASARTGAITSRSPTLSGGSKDRIPEQQQKQQQKQSGSRPKAEASPLGHEGNGNAKKG